MKYLLVFAIAVAALVLVGCGEDTKAGRGEIQGQSQKAVATYQPILEAAVPYPIAEIKDSQERRNVRERLLRFNDANKIGYVYLLSDFGTVVSYFTIKGKVSSASSQLTATEQSYCVPIKGRDDPCFIVDSPTDDGSYGPNEPGIFFFTTEGVLITWNGAYLYSDYPLDVQTEPVAIYDAQNAKPSSTGSTP